MNIKRIAQNCALLFACLCSAFTAAAAKDDAEPWVELSFPKLVKIGALDIYSGYKNEAALEAFDLTFEVNGKQVSPAAGKVRDNREVARRAEVLWPVPQLDKNKTKDAEPSPQDLN